MANENRATPKETILIGIAFTAVGLYIIMAGAGLLPVPGGPNNLHAPIWVAAAFGLIFFLAGAAAVLQWLGGANDQGELPAAAAAWMRAAQRLFVVAIFVCFALIGGWVALMGEDRYFSGPLPGEAGVLVARIAFGIGALMCWAAAIGLAVSSARRLIRARESP